MARIAKGIIDRGSVDGVRQLEMGVPEGEAQEGQPLATAGGRLKKEIPSGQFLNSLQYTEFDPSDSGLAINTENAASSTPQPDDLAVGPFQMRLKLARELFETGEADGLIDQSVIDTFVNGNDQEQAGVLVTQASKLNGLIAEKTQESLNTMGDYGSTVIAQNLFHNAPTATKNLIDRAFGGAAQFKDAVQQRGAEQASRELLDSISKDPLAKFKTDRSRNIFQNRVKSLQKHVTELEDANYDPTTLPDELRQLWQEYHPQSATAEQHTSRELNRQNQIVQDVLVGVVADPKTDEEVYQTSNHVIEQLVADPLLAGDYARGAIGRWMYGGTDADLDSLPEKMDAETFLRDVLKIDYPKSATQGLEFNKDVPPLVNIMGWVGAATVEGLRQVPIVATSILTDPISFMGNPLVGAVNQPSKFGAQVWDKLKSWFVETSPTRKKVVAALGPTQHMPHAFTKFEEMRAEVLKKNKEMFKGEVRPIHKVFEEANANLLPGQKWTPDKLRAIGFNEVLNDADQAAFILTLTKEADGVLDAARSGNLKEFYSRLKVTVNDLIVNNATRTASGRGQRILEAEQAEAMKRWSDELMKMFDNRKLSPQELMRNVALMDNPQDMLAFVKNTTRPGFMAMVAEQSVNGLLGGATTLAVNAISGPLMMVHHGLSRVAAGLFSWNRSKSIPLPKGFRGSGVTRREGVDFMMGAAGAFSDGMRAFKKAWVLQDATSPGTKFDTFRQHAITGDNVAAMLKGPFKIPLVKWMIDGYGTLTRLPGRALLATDEMNKTMIWRGEVKALSSRVARDEAARLFPTDPVAALAHYNKVRMDVITNPENYKDVFKAATHRAQELTFTNPSDLKVVRDYSNFVSEHPGLRIVTPFVNVPVNIMQTGLDMMPTTAALKLAHDLVHKGLTTNDPVKRQMLMGKLAVATAMSMGIAADILGGNLSGSGPADPAQRRLKEATGWKPYSRHTDTDGDGVKDTWIEYGRVDPWGFAMGLHADLYESLGWLEGVDDGTGPKPAGWYAQKFGMDMTLAMLQNIEDATFISSAVKFSELIDATGSRDPEAVGRAVARFSQALVPFSGTLKMATRQITPEMREVRMWLDGIRSVVPGMSTFTMRDDHPMKPFYPGKAPTLAQSYDALGNPQNWHHGYSPADLPNWLSEYVTDAAEAVNDAIMPIRESKDRDPRLKQIAHVFLQNNIELERPDRKKDGYEIPIIYYDAIQKLTATGTAGLPEAIVAKLKTTEAGRKLLKGADGKSIPPLVDSLTDLVNAPAFKGAGMREQKQAIVSSHATARRNWAFGVLMLVSPELRAQYEQHLAIITQQGQPVKSNARQGAF